MIEKLQQLTSVRFSRAIALNDSVQWFLSNYEKARTGARH